VSHINITILYIRAATPFSCYFDKRLTGRFALPTKYPNLKICVGFRKLFFDRRNEPTPTKR
jgi:hypothetical protein